MRQDAEALKKDQCPIACASQWRQPSLFGGNDTHAVVLLKVGTRARDTHEVWSNVSVGCEPGLKTCAQTRMRVSMNVRPLHLVNEQATERKSEKKEIECFRSEKVESLLCAVDQSIDGHRSHAQVQAHGRCRGHRGRGRSTCRARASRSRRVRIGRSE